MTVSKNASGMPWEPPVKHHAPLRYAANWPPREYLLWVGAGFAVYDSCGAPLGKRKTMLEAQALLDEVQR